MSYYVENLIKTVVERSQANTWENAVNEWTVEPYGESDGSNSVCACGKEDILYLFKITNIENGNEIYPIGSSCMKKFERKDINDLTSLYEQLYKLKKALNENKYLDFTSEFFTRKILAHFNDKGVYNSDYNNNNGTADYEFMVKMFNKKNKEDITPSQRKKINGIIAYQIKPYLRDKLNV